MTGAGLATLTAVAVGAAAGVAAHLAAVRRCRRLWDQPVPYWPAGRSGPYVGNRRRGQVTTLDSSCARVWSKPVYYDAPEGGNRAEPRLPDPGRPS